MFPFIYFLLMLWLFTSSISGNILNSPFSSLQPKNPSICSYSQNELEPTSTHRKPAESCHNITPLQPLLLRQVPFDRWYYLSSGSGVSLLVHIPSHRLKFVDFTLSYCFLNCSHWCGKCQAFSLIYAEPYVVSLFSSLSR